MNVSSETAWSDIQEFAKFKYQVSIVVSKSLQGMLDISRMKDGSLDIKNIKKTIFLVDWSFAFHC